MNDLPTMPQGPMAGPTTVRIPLKALAQPDDADNMVQPAEGDTTSFTVEGTIQAIDGEFALVEPKTVNGKPLAEETPEAAEQNEAEGLREEAGAML